MITGIAHINLLVPPGTLPHATTFYSTTLGLTPRPVPAHRVHDLAWFDIGSSGQQVHIAPGTNEEPKSSRHPCFKLGSPEQLIELRARIWDHYERGGEAAPLEADKPGVVNSGMFVLEGRSMVVACRVFVLTRRRRRSRGRVPAAVLRARLRRQQAGVQSVK